MHYTVVCQNVRQNGQGQIETHFNLVFQEDQTDLQDTTNGEIFVRCKSSRDLDRQYFDQNVCIHIPPPLNEGIKILILYNSHGKDFW